MLGVILCGGQSIRMGTDKGLIKLYGKTWAQTAANKLSCLHLNVLISVNPAQFNDYLSGFNIAQLITDHDELPVKGPLAGVLSVHQQYPGEDLLVLACDMPLMETTLLQELLLIYHENPAADAFVFSNEGEPEPLCAIYTAKGLSYIMYKLKAKELPKHSMKFVLEQLNSFDMPLNEEQKKYFQNFNTPDSQE